MAACALAAARLRRAAWALPHCMQHKIYHIEYRGTSLDYAGVNSYI